MGYSKRKLNQRKIILKKQIKKPLNETIKLMQKGFADSQYVEEFHRCYRYLWDDLMREYNYYSHKNKSFTGRKPLIFRHPYKFVLSCAYHLIKRARKNDWHYLSKEEIAEHRQHLVTECNKKIKKRHDKQEDNLKLLQKIAPGYGDSMIKSYFYQWYRHPEDVDTRYYILNEIAKFNSEKYVGFLIHVMATDTNDYCREFALYTLHKWGKNAVLKKKRKGKSRPGDHIKPSIPQDPTSLMGLIERMQMEHDKCYNVFISHRSTEAQLIIEIKNQLNMLGYSVYVDWMIDKDALEPSKYNENTWPVLKHRLLHCDNVLYVHTASCLDSKWIPRELQSAKENSKNIIVLNTDESEEPAYCNGYRHITSQQLNQL